MTVINYNMCDKSTLNKKWGLVLAGGGGKGAYQIGAFKALRECGISKNIIALSGTSVGALNMCIFCQPDENIGSVIWNSLSTRQLLNPDLKYFDFKEGIFGREGLEKIMDDYINFEFVTESSVDMYATITKINSNGLDSKKPIYYKVNNKDIDTVKNVLLASSAMPIIYEPVEIDGIRYRDGGITDNMPIKPIYDLGIRNIIVISLSHKAKIPKEEFEDCEFIHICPSKDLGDIFSGTLNFDKKGIKLRINLGYLDAARMMMFYNPLEKNLKDFESGMRQLADQDFRNILMELNVNEMQENIDTKLNDINAYIDKVTKNI